VARGRVRYWAAARDAAGCSDETYDAPTLAAALAGASAGRSAHFAAVLAVSSYLVDGEPTGTRDPASVELPDDAEIDVLPPFAGG